MFIGLYLMHFADKYHDKYVHSITFYLYCHLRNFALFMLQ